MNSGKQRNGRFCIFVASIVIVSGVFEQAWAQKIYWTDPGADKIQRSNLDGSNIEDLGDFNAVGMALDTQAEKIYWADRPGGTVGPGYIRRADLDGTNLEDVVELQDSTVSSIALDISSGKMYWTEDVADKIQRADLDGSNVEDLVTPADGLLFPRGLALDLGNGKMYWCDRFGDLIQRANLDGSNIETILTSANGIDAPDFLTLDLVNGLMYWSGALTIERANLDGSNHQILVTTSMGVLVNSGPIALDVPSGKMYWVNEAPFDTKIHRSNLNGTNIETLITAADGIVAPFAMALDLRPEDTNFITIRTRESAFFAEGTRLELEAPSGSGYQWKRDGVPLADDAPRFTGTNGKILAIQALELSDSGNYAVSYDDGAKIILQTPPLPVAVTLITALPTRPLSLVGITIIFVFLTVIRRFRVKRGNTLEPR